MNAINKLFNADAYKVERGGHRCNSSFGGGQIGFEEKAYGTTEQYDGTTLRPDKSGGYLGADGKSSLVSVEGTQEANGTVKATITDVDPNKNLELKVDIDKGGNALLRVTNPGDNGALSVIAFDFGHVDDAKLFGTSVNYGKAEQLDYSRFTNIKGDEPFYGFSVDNGAKGSLLVENFNGNFSSGSTVPLTTESGMIDI